MNLLGGSVIERGRKNRRNIRKSVTRNTTMLDQTILRRILFTAGSGVLSTTAPAGLATGFAAGGNGDLAAGGTTDGVPAANVSPGCDVVALFGERSGSSGLSTIAVPPSVRLGNYTLQHCHRVQTIQLPALQGTLSAQVQIFVYT